jgi:hypothetical protein
MNGFAKRNGKRPSAVACSNYPDAFFWRDVSFLCETTEEFDFFRTP